jgi:hypothetical protein
VVFGITAVTTAERLFSWDTTVVINEPIASIQKIWPELKARSQVRIILSHLGETESAALLARFPDCALVVNGHRKQAMEPVVTRGGQRLMQFGFEGKKLSFQDLQIDKKETRLGSGGWLTLGPEVADDAAMQKLIAAAVAPAASSVPTAQLDLYVMSQCPYGLAALEEIVPLAKRFKGLTLSVHFIGSVSADSSLRSLHGPDEASEEQLWLAIEELYPRQYLDFLEVMAAGGTGTVAALSRLKMDPARLDTWVKTRGKAALIAHYRRSERLGINSSPTLLWNNLPAEFDLKRLRVVKRLCAEGLTGALCDSVPECFEDRDCRKPGKNGHCSAGGRCQFVDAASFDFVVVTPDSALSHPEQGAIATTQELFGGAKIRTLTLSSKDGAALIKQLQPAGLPLYLFGPEVGRDPNFSKIESGVEKLGKWYTFRDGVMPRHYFHLRPWRSSETVLLIDPLFPGVSEALKAVLAADSTLDWIKVVPVFFGDPADPKQPVEERLRQEEGLRWLILAHQYKAKYPAYLRSYIEHPASSYWFMALDSLGIEPKELFANVKASGNMLTAHSKLLQELGLSESVQFLVHNREVAVVKSQGELVKLLGKLGGK